jgi:hypothetical protein
MTEYQGHIEIYSNHWQQHFQKMFPQSKWGDKEAAERYLEKYWLPSAEYERQWKQIQDQIFINQNGLPDLVFAPQYEMLAFRGGCLFIEEDFKKLQECFINVGGRHFSVIENTFGGKLNEPPFRMKYPVDISWPELISGNFVSAMLFHSLHKEYFVFDETAAWGEYAASDYESPLNIVGVLPQYSSLFREKLKVSEKERQEIASWLPPKYRRVT